MRRKKDEVQDVREAVCLAAWDEGMTTRQLASIYGVTVRTIQRWLTRSRLATVPVRLELLMSGAGKACIHGRPLVLGMPVLCLDCDQTGIPGHPAFRQDKNARAWQKPKEPAKFQPRLKSAKKTQRNG
jgi:hypothetical protein